MEFGADGPSLTAARHQPSWRAALTLARAGCAGAVRPVAVATPRLAPARHRVEYRRGAITEWYVSGPRGLEQGFTLDHPPGCSRTAARALRLEVAVVGDLTPELRGDQVLLRNAGGQVALRYGELHAHDARGRQLPAQLALFDRRIALDIDARGATYPVTVDPLVWVEQQQLVPDDGSAGGFFGQAIAMAGDTLVVGESFGMGVTSYTGAAHVFVRRGGVWTRQQRLFADDGVQTAWFGYSLAVSGDTVVVGAPQDDDQGTFSGSAYVFVRQGEG